VVTPQSRLSLPGGRRVFICGPRWARELHETISGSQLVTFEHSGHFVHIEEAGEFASAVAGFVERNVPET
jgi:pimeloyl-ACP methyl ester carboxylesterase